MIIISPNKYFWISSKMYNYSLFGNTIYLFNFLVSVSQYNYFVNGIVKIKSSVHIHSMNLLFNVRVYANI